MDELSFEDLAREYGIDEADNLSFHDDSGLGFTMESFNSNSANNQSSAPYYGMDESCDYGNEHLDDSTRFYHINQSSGFPSTVQGYANDAIEDYQSSDNFSATFSSPSPAVRAWQNSSGMMPTRIPRQAAISYTNQRDNPPRQSAYIQGTNDHHRQATPMHGAQEANRSTSIGPRNTHGIRLRPVSELPDIYRGIFKFGVFNAMQSKCFGKIMDTSENMVVSAPTGGGKTVLFELALIKLLMTSGQHAASKCVYVAPTKALCSERYRDWLSKFEPLGIKCCEMTGDTAQMGKNAWNEAKGARIIITTSEKWDSLTRSWHDHGNFLKQIQLFLVDEVHILNESRGGTLEVVISRMKALGLGVRFLLVSATVPNISDIAEWVGNPFEGVGYPAAVFEFGEAFRPCKITRHVYGFPRKNQNDFQFSRTLDFKLYDIIQQHACGKPILIFCSTRKGVMSTGEQLLKEYEQSLESRQTPPWAIPRHIESTFYDKKLDKLAKAGIGIHHAGLNFDDRRSMEDLFLNGSLRVVVATSTLAVGVNLPAHTVVIKGVKIFQGNAWQEYSDLDIVQMIGRAGRPQFDKEGVAIIMCEQVLENKYRNLVQGTTVLESSLHQHISEHINSEIGIGTITNIETAKEWLRNSFLRQRIQKNPAHYNMGKTEGQTWEEKLDNIVLQSVRKLEANELIRTNGEDSTAELTVTDYGEIMSKYYIRQTTMSSILKLSENATVREILEVISAAEELGDVRLRGGDKQVYGKMRDHPDIRYKIKKIDKACDKAFMLIQAVLGGISLSAAEYKTADSQPALDALTVFRHTARIARVVVEVAIVKKNGAQLKHGLELVRCLTAKAWEDRPVVLKQIDTIGEKSLKVLAEHGITSFKTLRKQNPARVELLLNRRPPYGHEVLAFVNDLPLYLISVKEESIETFSGERPIQIELTISCGLENKLRARSKSNKSRMRSFGMTSILTTTSDLGFVDFRRISTRALGEPKTFTVTAELSKPSQTISILMSSESYAGLTVTETYKPLVASKEYPTLDTRPRNIIDYELEGLEDDPDFWSNIMDEDDNADSQDARLTAIQGNGAGEGSTLLKTLDKPAPTFTPASQEAVPRKLANGNYACNHTCKDKTKCRHLCCRDGLPKPPVNHKTSLTDKLNPTLKAKEKKAQVKKMEDTRLKKLEDLHSQTGVSRSLKLPEGRRIKLSDSNSSKPKKDVDFNIKFAKLTDEESPESLPNSQEVLASVWSKTTQNHRETPRKRISPPSTDYDDPELDAIMLTFNAESTDMGCETKTECSSIKRKPEDIDQPSPCGSAQKNNLISEKYGQSASQSQQSIKRRRHYTDEHLTANNAPLFFPDPPLLTGRTELTSTSRGDDIQPTGSEDDDDYLTLDSTLFEITPSHRDNHDNIMEDGVTSCQENINPCNIIHQKESDRPQVMEPLPNAEVALEVDNANDAWTDFEDWLKTSVVIVTDT